MQKTAITAKYSKRKIQEHVSPTQQVWDKIIFRRKKKRLIESGKKSERIN